MNERKRCFRCDIDGSVVRLMFTFINLARLQTHIFVYSVLFVKLYTDRLNKQFKRAHVFRIHHILRLLQTDRVEKFFQSCFVACFKKKIIELVGANVGFHIPRKLTAFFFLLGSDVLRNMNDVMIRLRNRPL